jgi:addiction module HigA family antidote
MKTTATTMNIGPGPKIHPGLLLKKYVLDECQISQTKFAAVTGLPVSRVNDIVRGRRGITMDAAIRISRALGQSDDYWLNLQAAYDRACALQERGAEYAAIQPMLVTGPA